MKKFMCLCCEEVPVKRDGDECEFCRLTYRTYPPASDDLEHLEGMLEDRARE